MKKDKVMEHNKNVNVIDEVVVEKRRELRDHLKNEFPSAEITVKNCCDREIAKVELNGGDHAGAAEKISKIKEKALPKLPFIRIRDLDFGFSLEGPSPSHLLLMLQE